MDNITIDVADMGTEGLFGDDELWINVTGPDPLPDYTTIRRLAVEKTGRTDIPHAPLRYFPSWGGPGEDYAEVWVVRKVAS